MIEPLTLLLWALPVGATAAGMIVVIRVLPLIRQQVEAMKKPWACDICMSFWVVGLLVLLLLLGKRDPQFLFVAGPAFPFALWFLRRLTDPPELPPLLLEDSDAKE